MIEAPVLYKLNTNTSQSQDSPRCRGCVQQVIMRLTHVSPSCLITRMHHGISPKGKSPLTRHLVLSLLINVFMVIALINVNLKQWSIVKLEQTSCQIMMHRSWHVNHWHWIYYGQIKSQSEALWIETRNDVHVYLHLSLGRHVYFLIVTV